MGAISPLVISDSMKHSYRSYFCRYIQSSKIFMKLESRTCIYQNNVIDCEERFRWHLKFCEEKNAKKRATALKTLIFNKACNPVISKLNME